jgi:archaeosine-15-forming tRNA-guanine transglycosylase
MSSPTVLAPWFVVQRRFKEVNSFEPEVMQYYRTDEEGSTLWTENPNEAMLFMSLHSAHRVAQATATEVRVVVDKNDLAEFRPKGEI